MKDTIRAWKAGLVCLHPTDTLPGLSFHPGQEEAWSRFLRIKQRPPEKTPIALIASCELAMRCWQVLPQPWEATLKGLWPASLSVVWKASPDCPRHLLAEDGTCSLRMPAWSPDLAWMKDFLRELAEPFPSSSVNASGQPPICDWEEAKAFLAPFVRQGQAYIPESTIKPSFGSVSSTLIKIEDNGSWKMLRAGAISSETIERELQKHVSPI